MHYAYNRKAFRSIALATNVQPLAAAYNACILLELALKEHLGFCNTPLNRGHNLPELIQRVGLSDRRMIVTMNAFMAQLSFRLASLYSQSKDGTPRRVPANSYPHIRYLRHSSDWNSDCSSDDDIVQLKGLVEKIGHQLSTRGGVSL